MKRLQLGYAALLFLAASLPAAADEFRDEPVRTNGKTYRVIGGQVVEGEHQLGSKTIESAGKNVSRIDRYAGGLVALDNNDPSFWDRFFNQDGKVTLLRGDEEITLGKKQRQMVAAGKDLVTIDQHGDLFFFDGKFPERARASLGHGFEAILPSAVELRPLGIKNVASIKKVSRDGSPDVLVTLKNGSEMFLSDIKANTAGEAALSELLKVNRGPENVAGEVVIGHVSPKRAAPSSGFVDEEPYTELESVPVR